jgi:hypothetical protein
MTFLQLFSARKDNLYQRSFVCRVLTMDKTLSGDVSAGGTPFPNDRTTGKMMIQIKLTRSDVDHRWSVSLLDRQNILWSSPETFDSPDTAYYRAIGEYVLLQKWDGPPQKTSGTRRHQ